MIRPSGWAVLSFAAQYSPGPCEIPDPRLVPEGTPGPGYVRGRLRSPIRSRPVTVVEPPGEFFFALFALSRELTVLEPTRSNHRSPFSLGAPLRGFAPFARDFVTSSQPLGWVATFCLVPGSSNARLYGSSSKWLCPAFSPGARHCPGVLWPATRIRRPHIRVLSRDRALIYS